MRAHRHSTKCDVYVRIMFFRRYGPWSTSVRRSRVQLCKPRSQDSTLEE